MTLNSGPEFSGVCFLISELHLLACNVSHYNLKVCPFLFLPCGLWGGCENLECLVFTEKWLQLEKAVSLPEIYFNLGEELF